MLIAKKRRPRRIRMVQYIFQDPFCLINLTDIYPRIGILRPERNIFSETLYKGCILCYSKSIKTITILIIGDNYGKAAKLQP